MRYSFGLTSKAPKAPRLPTEISDRPKLVNIDTGGLRMGFGTFIALVTGLIGAVVTVATFVTNIATRDDLTRPARDADGQLISAPYKTAEQVAAHERTIEALRETLKAQAQEQKAVRARLDFLIEQRLLQEENDPRAVRASRKAAAKVRERAGEEDADPLSGIIVH